jgi:outer membrane murein-binding lipoprotein Lpp
MPLSLINIVRIAIFLAATLLSGCASTRLVESRVNSFAPQVVHPGATYQFERLPSQVANPASQDKLEALAQEALLKVGLSQNIGAALRVQVSAVQRQETTSTDGGLHIGVGLGWVFGNGSIGIGNRGALFPGLDQQTSYWRQVSVVMRDAAGAVVYETHASNDSVWADGNAVLGAMLDAALDGFPNPPSGVRQVRIGIPR